MLTMTNESRQIDFIVNLLKKKGHVSRNQCLSNYISRLGSRICDLNKIKGWKIIGQYEKTATGRDYVYYAIKKPKK